MANRYTQTFVADVQLNGKGAINNIDLIEKEIKKLKQEARDMKLGGKEGSKEYKETMNAVKDLEKEVKKAKNEVLDLGKSFSTAGKSVAGLKNELKIATQQYNRLTNEADRNKMALRIRQIKTALQEMNGQLDVANTKSSAFGRLARRAAEYTGMYMLINRSRQIVTNAIQGNLALSDSISDIQKVSGLSEEAVKGLVSQIEKIDSRNAPEVLNNMAYAAGKLGIKGAENLLGFTRAADKLNVALKEYLGDGADGVVSLMKFANVMGTTEKYGVEQALIKTGSALNYMTQSTAAAADYMIEFASRFGPIARQARMTSGDVIGLASALDALAVNNEEAATSLQKFVIKVLSSPVHVAKTLGMDADAAKEMVETGKSIELVEMALAKLGERAEKYGVSGITSVIGDIGSKGQAQRLIKTLATLANNTQMVHGYVVMANDAFKEGTSVINEYNIKNQNAAAIWERMKNIWTKFLVNSGEVGVIKDYAQSLYDTSVSLQRDQQWIMSVKTAFGMLIGVIKTFVEYLPTIITFVTTLSLSKMAANIIASARAFLVLRQSMISATLASQGFAGVWRSITVMLRANAIGLVITGISLLVTWIERANAKAKEAKLRLAEVETESQKLRKAVNEFGESAGKAAYEVSELFAQLKATKEGTDERAKLLTKINSTYKNYLSNLLTEKSSLVDIAKAQEEVNNKIRQRIALEAMQGREKEISETFGGAIGDESKAILDMLKDKYGVDNAYKYQYRIVNLLTQYRAEHNNRIDNTQKAVDYIIREMIKPEKDEEGKVTAAGVNLMGKGRLVDENGKLVPQAVQGEIDLSDRPGGSQHMLDEWMQNSDNQNMLLASRINNLVDYSRQQDEAIQAMHDQFDALVGTITEATSGNERTEILPEQMTSEERQAEVERQKALRMEMKSEQEQAKAIIDNVKNYYERQTNAITQLATEVGMDPKIQEQMVDGMTVRMNDALANVRKAIGGTENEWEKFKQTMRQDLYEPLDESGENFSTELLDKVMDNNVAKLRKMIETLSKELNQQGSVLLDQILRKATENEGKNAKLANKLMREREKELLAKNYTGKVDKDTEGIMEQFGIAGLTSQQSTQIRDWSLAGNDKEIETFLTERSKMWQEAFVKARENAIKLMQADVNREGGQDTVLTLLFGDNYKEALQGSALEGMLKMSLDQWQVFYMKLIEYGDKWVDAQKKQYEEIKKRQDYLFNLRPDIRAIDESIKTLKEQDDQLKKLGLKKGSNFGEMTGFSNIENDPELVRLQLLEERAERYYQNMQRLREQNYADESQVTTALNALVEAQSATQERLIARINERAEKLTTLGEPIVELGSEIGKAMYDQWHNGESMTIKWQDMLKKMGLAWGELTVKVTSELMMQKIKQKILDKAMQMEETAHQTAMAGIQQAGAASRTAIEEASGTSRIAAEQSTNAILETEQAAHNTQVIQEDTATAVDENAINTSRAAGKTLADLGWWGIPLVAVITALLNMLLQAALGSSQHKANQKKDKSLRLVSGMLVYDEGNVSETLNGFKVQGSRFKGTDGRSYAATATPTPEGTALVRHPIATMIGGQPALVGERGTELIIGRRTLRDMSQFRPDLLQQLYAFEKRRFRTYDEGNVGDIGSRFKVQGSSQDPQMQQTLQSLQQTVAMLSSTMEALQRNGIYAKINKYGAGGLVDEVADGLYTTKKRGNNTNVRRLFG